MFRREIHPERRGRDRAELDLVIRTNAVRRDEQRDGQPGMAADVFRDPAKGHVHALVDASVVCGRRVDDSTGKSLWPEPRWAYACERIDAPGARPVRQNGAAPLACRRGCGVRPGVFLLGGPRVEEWVLKNDSLHYCAPWLDPAQSTLRFASH